MSNRHRGASFSQRTSLGLAKPLQLALVAMGGVLMVYAQAVAALGVGEPRYLSHLFEPLRVDIPVEVAQGVHDNPGVQLSLVNGNQEHSAADNTLQSEWLIDSKGVRILRVWTSKPVSEPMLNLRIDVDSEGVQVQRELSLLFDPAPIEVATDPAPASAPTATAATRAAPPAAVMAAIRADAGAARKTPVATPVADAPSVATIRAKPTAAAVEAKAVAAASPDVRASAAAPSRTAQIASTHAAPALSAADRWQRIPVAEGDTLEQLAARARGDHDLPLPVVAMLLRWLNPRSFDGAVGKPLPGAMLRFPKPESLAAQMAASGDIWAPAAVAVASPPPVTAAATKQDDQLAVALASAGILAGVPASLSGPAVSSGGSSGMARMSGGVTLGAMLVTVLSTILMLKMIAGTPAPIAQRYLQAQVLSRSEAAAAPGSARVLPTETLAFSLDLAGRGAQAADDPVELLRAHTAAREARRATRHPQA